MGVQKDEIEIYLQASANLARRSKEEICEYLFEKSGLQIELVSPYWSDALTFNNVRNLIVHRSSEIDGRFIAYARGKNLPFELKLRAHMWLTERWVMETAAKIDECVFAIDDFVGSRLGVFRRFRDGHFWISRSALYDPFEGHD